MEVKDYCSNVDMELTLWEAKIFDPWVDPGRISCYLSAVFTFV